MGTRNPTVVPKHDERRVVVLLLGSPPTDAVVNLGALRFMCR